MFREAIGREENMIVYFGENEFTYASSYFANL